MRVRLLTHVSGAYYDSDGVRHEWPEDARGREVEVSDDMGAELLRNGWGFRLPPPPEKDKSAKPPKRKR